MIICQQTRGLLSSNDQLALDLPFAETKSIAARVGPNPVFTRAATATYFGPKIEAFGYVLDFDGFVGGRVRWYTIFDPINGYSIAVSYNGIQWELENAQDEVSYFYAAEGNEWRPDQADWSGSGINVTTSSTFGIVRAAINEPRLEHDPLTGVCYGLLLEQSRTNLAFPSDMVSPWLVNRVTQTSSTGSPLGTFILLTTTEATGAARSSRTVVVPSSQPYTISVFAKAGTVSSFAFRALTDASSSVAFNVLNGTTSGSNGTGWSGQAQITPYPDGWYRCSMTYTPTALSQAYCVDLIYSAIGQTIGFTGFQLEASPTATATSYIPTTTGSAIRAQDLYTITGANFLNMYNQSEGTVFCAAIAVGATNASSGVYGITAASRPAGGIGSDFNAANLRVAVHAAPSFATQASFSSSAARNVLVKSAIAVRTDDFAGSTNGSIATDTSGTLVTIMDRFVIGATGNTGGPQVGNTIFSSIRYYRKRLPNSKLQALTAP